ALTNTANEDTPGGLGIHPWWRAADGFRFRVPASEVFGLPADRLCGPHPQAVDPGHDLRALAPPRWGLDHVWTALDAQLVELTWPDVAVAARLTFGERVRFVGVAAFEDFGAVAIEPQTHAPDGLGRLARGEPGAIGVLQRGQTLQVRYELTVQRPVPHHRG